MWFLLAVLQIFDIEISRIQNECAKNNYKNM